MSNSSAMYEVDRRRIVIPQAGWTRDGELWACVVACGTVRPDTDVDVAVDRESIGAPLCGLVEPMDGEMRVYAYTKPAEDILATVKVMESV